MLFENLNHEERIETLERLHDYLNRKYFNDELSHTVAFEVAKISGCEVMFMADIDDTMIITFDLQAVIRNKFLANSIGEAASERRQLQWLVTSMLRAMVYQQIYEQDLPDEDYKRLAENVGLMDAGKQTEWINPLRFSFIEHDFSLYQVGRGAVPLPESFNADDAPRAESSSLPWH